MTESDCLGWVQLDLGYDQHAQDYVSPDSQQLDDSSEASGGCCYNKLLLKHQAALNGRDSAIRIFDCSGWVHARV